ncbi:FAD-dependent oxidoreductase [Nocardioides humi]|uniref:Amine oxidase domain-containing protein n=1 Tax=Nocardioides humi TaxID=449461 RepID=A0ABN2C134_9ACTN|nr:FAD-dependent oxidoreductase [Nocardioides humi]
MPEEEIERRFRADLCRLYPQLASLIAETAVQKWEHGNWYQTPSSDFDAVLRYAESPASTVHLAGDYFAPVSGSVEDAATSGVTTARRVAAALQGR